MQNKSLLRRMSFILSLFFSVSLLVACSGGGGGGGGDGDDTLSYSGATTPASITRDNAEDLARAAFENGNIGNTLGDIVSSMQETPKAKLGLPRLLILANILEKSVDTIKPYLNQGQTSIRTPQSSEIEESGSCGGSMTGTVTVDNETGYFSAVFSYDEFCEGGATIDGSMTLEATASGEGEFFSLSMTIDLSFESDGDVATIQGEISFDYSGQQVSMAMDVLIQDSSDGEVYWIDDYEWTITDYGSYIEVSISGSFYSPDDGYITITTIQPIVINEGDDGPSAGVMIITGANNSSAQITILSTTSFMIELDADGDGIYEEQWTVTSDFE